MCHASMTQVHVLIFLSRGGGSTRWLIPKERLKRLLVIGQVQGLVQGRSYDSRFARPNTPKCAWRSETVGVVPPCIMQDLPKKNLISCKILQHPQMCLNICNKDFSGRRTCICIVLACHIAQCGLPEQPERAPRLETGLGSDHWQVSIEKREFFAMASRYAGGPKGFQ